eukprot:symbB.v1.2.038868.t1/scaffold6206.1/size20105/1
MNSGFLLMTLTVFGMRISYIHKLMFWKRLDCVGRCYRTMTVSMIALKGHVCPQDGKLPRMLGRLNLDRTALRMQEACIVARSHCKNGYNRKDRISC